MAVLISADEARRAKLRLGQDVMGFFETGDVNPVGMLAHLKLPPFRRAHEHHDRI